MKSLVDRRRFLLQSLGSAGAWALVGCKPIDSVRAEAADGSGALVLIQLTGGNDGLSTVVPYADDAYGRTRRKVRPDPKTALLLDDYRGLHPALGNLRFLPAIGAANHATCVLILGANGVAAIRLEFDHGWLLKSLGAEPKWHSAITANPQTTQAFATCTGGYVPRRSADPTAFGRS